DRDWSSDVCSSDLTRIGKRPRAGRAWRSWPGICDRRLPSSTPLRAASSAPGSATATATIRASRGPKTSCAPGCFGSAAGPFSRLFRLFGRERLLRELAAVSRESLDLRLGLFQPLREVLGQHDAFFEKRERLLEALVAALELAHELLERGQRALERLRLLFGLRHDVTSQLISPSDRRTRTKSPSLTWAARNRIVPRLSAI